MKTSAAIFSFGAMTMLAGCGSTGGVMKLGPDTYTVSASRHYTSGGAAAKTNALSAANAHCEQLGRELLVTNLSDDFNGPFYTSAITFNCFQKNDPRLIRPSYKKSPDVLIENVTK
jgi:hypothetical protein